MLKIQTAVKISEKFPAGRSSEYIWLDGQPWPVPEEERVMRLEAFGDELNNAHVKRLTNLFRSEKMYGAAATKPLIHVCWFTEEAQKVSEQMRYAYPEPREA